ncbi:MAG: replicative DNA helicase [Xylanivirga thermophila]|uniref:replicative DNA helicase n=1 Tax=Xylanivirga thermophila TaxID=2496273 RepID=UPI00101BE017|nr:replicative DNA helicase [Xylanivirga thermophila]
MRVAIGDVLENYGERISRLSIYEPLLELKNKRERDNSGKPIDCVSLGFIALLFFFENMIIRNKETGINELAEFFYEMNNGNIDLDIDGFRKLARKLIDNFRPPSGQRNSKTFYNWETGEEQTAYYSILKASKSDPKFNTQYYTLDEEGLELIFATKEYFSEFQLSINQLLLRKQLEKGEFTGALRQIDEMMLSVENLRDRMTKIEHDVNINIISEKTYRRYSKLIEDINIRLTRENEEFDELQSFVKDTKENMKYEIKDEKDKKAYQLIIEIDKKLDKVHSEHRNLLKESLSLKTTALEAARESLYFMGLDAFNFKEEITKKFISIPLPLMASRQLISPFMCLGMYSSWSPIAVFDVQRIGADEDVQKVEGFYQPVDEAILNEYKEITMHNFKKIMECLLNLLQDGKQTTLKEVIDYMKINHQDILAERVFYDFWIILHQKSPILIDADEDNHVGLLKEATKLLIGRCERFEVVELDSELEINNRFKIKDMIIKLEETSNGI